MLVFRHNGDLTDDQIAALDAVSADRAVIRDGQFVWIENMDWSDDARAAVEATGLLAINVGVTPP
jgi:hypothetical protein